MITAAMVKELRERTGAGMMDCKKALEETGGDMEKAIEYLREKGLAAAAKKAGRIAAEGLVQALVLENGRLGAMVEVNCETDFVAKTDEFRSFVMDIVRQVAEKNPADVEELLNQPALTDPAKTVRDLVTEKIARIGENMSVRRFARYELAGNGLIDAYLHMGGKIGVLVQLETERADIAGKEGFRALARDIAMQIAAARPEYIKREDVPADVVAKEKEILKAQALNEGKPEHIAEKMVAGRLEKFFKEVCLLEQPFIKDQDMNISRLLAEKSKELGGEIKVTRFARFEMGEGLEKRKDNFAEEVAAQLKS
ncbi:MAG: elongation factor Ts [Eubacteriales bacterium]|nr:elongation factor Ts [Eubacteriales bacterium]